MTELALGLKLSADAASATAGIKVAREQLKGFREEQAKTTTEQKAATGVEDALKKKTEEYVQVLVKKVSTLGMNRQSLLQYEAAQLKLTEAEQKAVVSMQQSVDSYERKEATMEKIVGVAGRLAVAAAAAGVALAVMVRKEAIEQAVEAATAQVRLQSALKATGYAAGLTKKELNDLADKMANETLFDDESFRNAISTLLKFKNVQAESFEGAIRFTADLSTAMGMDLVSAAQAAGKGLQDVEGIQRIAIMTGGRLDKSVLDQITSLRAQGREAEAVALSLSVLEGNIKGTAGAMNTGLMKAQGDSKKAWDNLMESIGQTNIVGGRAERVANNMAQFFNILSGAINETDSTMLNLVADISKFLPLGILFSGQIQKIADEQDRRNAANAKPGSLKSELAAYLEGQEKEAAWRGKMREEFKQSFDADDARDAAAKEAAAKQAAAYAVVKQAADDYLTTLEEEIQLEGASIEEKILFNAAKKAATLATQKERDAHMEYATVLARFRQEQLDEIKAKKEAEDARKKSLDTQVKGIEALVQEIEKQKQLNEELEFGKGAWGDYEIAQAEAALAIAEYMGSSEEETAGLRIKIKLLRELAELKSTGETLKDSKDAEKDFYRNMERDAQRYGAVFEDIITQALTEGGITGSQAIEKLINGMILKPAIQGLSDDLGRLAAGGQVSANFGMNLATVGGSFAGGQLAGAAGAGTRGQQIGAQAGAIGAQVGMMVAGPVGAVVGAILGAAIGKFSDPDGLAERRGKFGAASTISGGVTPGEGFSSRFGNFGIGDTSWFSDDMKASINSFFTTLKTIDNTLAAKMTDAQRTAATSALNKSGEFGFGTEHTDVSASSAFPQIFRERYAAVLDTMGKGFGDFLRASEGTVQEMANIVDAVLGLANAGATLDQTIAMLSDSALPGLTGRMTALDEAVSAAQAGLKSASGGRDAEAMYAAEQELQAAIVNRYTMERDWVKQLADSLASLKQQAYEFKLSIAQKINSAGGSIDIAALAGGRGTDVRNSLSAITDPSRRLSAINSYVSAIDTEYAARKAQILNAASLQQQQAQAAAAAQSAIAQAQMQAMQSQLDLANQWNGVLGQTRQMIEQMKYSAANPLAASGRYGLSVGDSNSLYAQFQAASGQAKIDLASRLLPSLQNRQQLLQETSQRPSDAYQGGYNSIAAMLAEVEQYSQTEADRAAALQKQMVDLQVAANSISVQAADSSNALLDELNAQYREQLSFADEEGAKAYAQQDKQHTELLNQITGGMEVDLYLAKLQTDSRDALLEIKNTIREFLGLASTSPGAVVLPVGGGNTGGGGDNIGTGNGSMSETPINIYIGGETVDQLVLTSVNRQPASIRRVLDRS